MTDTTAPTPARSARPETGPARYAKTEQAITNVTPKMLARIDRYAEHQEVSRAEGMRLLMSNALADFEENLDLPAVVLVTE